VPEFVGARPEPAELDDDRLVVVVVVVVVVPAGVVCAARSAVVIESNFAAFDALSDSESAGSVFDFEHAAAAASARVASRTYVFFMMWSL